MNIVFLGPPGAGKGTIAKKISGLLSIPHISTGDLFRNEIKKGTAIGEKVNDLIKSGELVPDALTIQLVTERLQNGDVENGFIFDGFPRTITQASSLEDIKPIHLVVNLTLPDSSVIKRLSGRRTCSNCGNMHHIHFMPPKTANICDRCGGNLFTRDDDKPQSIKNRLKVYKKQTEPLISYYHKKGNLRHVDASGTPEEVFSITRKTILNQ